MAALLGGEALPPPSLFVSLGWSSPAAASPAPLLCRELGYLPGCPASEEDSGAFTSAAPLVQALRLSLAGLGAQLPS